MSYEDIEVSVVRGLTGSAVIIFLGVTSDGWGQWTGCPSQVFRLFRGWLFLAVILTVASYVNAVLTNFNGGGDEWMGGQNVGLVLQRIY